MLSDQAHPERAGLHLFGALIVLDRRCLGRGSSRCDGAEVLCDRREDAARYLAERDADAVLAALAKRGDELGRGKVDELDIASDRLGGKPHCGRDIVSEEELADALLVFELHEARAIGLGCGARLRELANAAGSPTTIRRRGESV